MELNYLSDKYLSLKQKGLLQLLLTMQENNEQITIKNISKYCIDNTVSISNTLKFLINYGYVIRTKHTSSTTNGGRYVYEYVIKTIP